MVENRSLYESVGKTLKKLLLIDPYYGLFMMSLDKQETTRVPTLAVGLNGVNVVLYINPDFWFGMNMDERLGVCKHEMLHLCFMHLVSSEKYANHKVDNIATDAEINQYIRPEFLPKGGITLELIEKEFGVKLDPKKGRDHYYKELIQKVPKDFDLGSAEHFWEIFDKLSDAEKQIVQNQIQYLIERTSEELEKTRVGSTPGEIAGLIKLHKQTPKFDWKKYIRQWAGNSQEVYTKATRFKPNPYFPGTPSVKLQLKQNILWAIDTSGSVSDSELHECMAEMHNLWKFGHTITILCVDSKIYDPYVYKGQTDIKIHGRGGTTFTPTIEYFNSHPEYNAMIYFTDGEAELPPNTIKPMLWVISSRGTRKFIENHNGKILKIEA